MSFAGNDGLVDWSGPWIENDPRSCGDDDDDDDDCSSTAGPGAGHVRVTGGELRLDDYPDTGGFPSATREVNLLDVPAATLTFNFRTSSGVDSAIRGRTSKVSRSRSGR